LIAGSSEKSGYFVFHGALQDQARTQSTQLGQLLAICREVAIQQVGDLHFEPGARGYSFHLA
jgi:hypothetical protein